MAKIIAEFSNGHRDEYKGQRKVRAAWMITSKADGQVLASGHSLDREKAAKTAAGNVHYVAWGLVDGRKISLPRSAAYLTPQGARSIRESAAREGIECPKGAAAMLRAIRAHNAQVATAQAGAVKIEIVDLEVAA